MPFDQSFKTTHSVRPKHTALGVAVGLAALICFILGGFAATPLVWFGFWVCGIILGGFAVAILWERIWLQLRRARFDNAAISLMAQDTDFAFLTDDRDRILYANAIATQRFGLCVGRSLSDAFNGMLANPNGLLLRLAHSASGTCASKEDVITRNGHFRLGLSLVYQDRRLWRLDDLSDLPQIAHVPEQISLPLMQLSRDDKVIDLNDACQKLIGQRPRNLTDVIVDLPLQSGKNHLLHGPSGLIQSTVAVVKGPSGKRDVYFIPVVDDMHATPSFRVGWDEIEDLPVPLLKISRDGYVMGSNREARQLLNIEDSSGKQVSELLDGLGRPINDWLREAADGRGGHFSQFLRGRGNNQDTFVQVTLNASATNVDHDLIAVLNDVTELKTLEAQFVQSQKMQAIGPLAGGVAHDFNNLLTAISGHCDLLLLRHDEGDQNYGDLIQIHQNANRAASLVGQLLAFSRKQNLQPEVIDLRDTLLELMHLLNRLVGEKITLSLHHDPALAQIKADKRQLEQVLMNLVVNARDAMPAGGEITVRTENLTLKSQMIKDRAIVPPGEYVVVKVIDSGHGIPPEKLPKIFEPFYTTKRTGEGTGLGLSTAYGIVKQTGGFIFADSDVNRGTQFSLLFPSYDLPVAAPMDIANEATAIMNTNGDGVVLLVEDEAPVRAFASRALRLRGYTVLEADCAEAALDLLEDEELSVDIFVTDVIMPGMDGPTWVCKALQKRPNTKVVFMSGYAEDAFDDEKKRVPNSVFLPKPFSLNALTITVQQQLQDHRVPV